MVIVSKPSKLGYEFLLAGADLAVGGVRRLGLTGLMAVQEGENRPGLSAEGAGEPIGLVDHMINLGIRHWRREVAATGGGEPVHLIEDDEADPLIDDVEVAGLHGKGLP